jgi:hypothetical protein
MLRVTTEFTGVTGAPYYTTMHFEGDTSGEAVAAANAVRAFWFELQNRLYGLMVANVQDDVPNIDPATGQITAMFSAPTALVDFSNASEVLPFTSQALIRWRTGDFVGGRELRGRTFIPGTVETDSIDGTLNGTYVSALNLAASNLLSAATGAGGLVIWSPTNGVASLVTSASTWEQFAVLRSRRD